MTIRDDIETWCLRAAEASLYEIGNMYKRMKDSDSQEQKSQIAEVIDQSMDDVEQLLRIANMARDKE